MRQQKNDLLEVATPQSILDMLRRESKLISRVLLRLQTEGCGFLDLFEGGAFKKLRRSGMYRIGCEESAVFLSLPRSRAFLGRQYDEPCLVIPVWVGEERGEHFDIFCLEVRSRTAGRITITPRWHKEHSSRNWPAQEQDLVDIRQRLMLMFMVFSCLTRSSAQTAAA